MAERYLDVLIPTCDRPETWSLTMAHLRTNLGFLESSSRVIVGDSGATPLLAHPLARACWEIASSGRTALEYHRLPVHCGSAAARQALLDRVATEHYYIQDDDVVLPVPNLLQTLWLRQRMGHNSTAGVLLYYFDLWQANPVLDAGLKAEIDKIAKGASFIPAPHDSSCGIFNATAVRSIGGYNPATLGKGTGVDTYHCASLEAAGHPLEAYVAKHGIHLNLEPRRMVQDDTAFVKAVQANPALAPILSDRWGSAPCLSLRHFRG